MIDSIVLILTRLKTQFRVMIERMIATKMIIENATEIVKIDSITTRIDLK
jgi:hypothetical protein